MALLNSPAGELGASAPAFALPNPAGTTVSLDDARGPNGLVVMFICNHCPYVQAVITRVVDDMAALRAVGVGAVAIMPNDYDAYPDDAPDKMARFANQHGFDFPYVVDADQRVAKAYGAVCTPEFFGYDKALSLVYRGRLDAGRLGPPPSDDGRELFHAMRMVAGGEPLTKPQAPSMGCSIKWRTSPQ